MAENFSNDTASTLSSAMADGTTTTANITSATGFPAVNFRIRIDNEYMLVTSLGTGLNWTVTRGIEGTTAVAHSSGAAVYQIVTLGGLLQYITDRFQASGATLTSLEGLSLVAGDVLYATAADTLQRLAKGTALQQLRMNSGATAPEWATASGVSTDVGAGGVGAMQQMYNINGTFVAAGATSSGANLQFWPALSTSATGTWRNISGDSIADSTTGEFQRIS